MVKDWVKISAVILAASVMSSAIEISVQSENGVRKISPYIYGRNIDKISDTKETVDSEEQAFIDQMLEAGIHFLRANNGNNSTRYNWRKKLTVHPDWFNNVYDHDWGITAKKIQENMPGIDAMYAFQLTGYAASTSAYNFPDWDYYVQNNTYPNFSFDLAGGGVLKDANTLEKPGDYKLYNEEWPADSTVGIINNWRNELNLDMSRFKYWSMDNEMDIWLSTHGDLPLNVTPDFLVERYVDVAKKAKATWKDIKLTGPVVANEWQWCAIAASDEKGMGHDDRDYCWLEYFIKKVAEASQKENVRLLDVLDIHWYPSEKDYENRVNWYRVLFDTTYNYKGANGIKLANGFWDEKITKSYIFGRINTWLEKYFGKNHGITLAITETSLEASDAMTTALTYASFLGTMGDNGVEIFTPWSWGDGMYETAHLFSRYGHENRVQSTSSNDSLVSAYSSINNGGDSLTVILVNRAENTPQEIHLKVSDFKATEGSSAILSLSNLSGETFVSHSQNALNKSTVSVANNTADLTIPAKSITAVLLTSQEPKIPQNIKAQNFTTLFNVAVNGKNILVNGNFIDAKYKLSNPLGQIISSGIASKTLKISAPNFGKYVLKIGGEIKLINVK